MVFFNRFDLYFGVILFKHLNRGFYIQILIKTWSNCCTAHASEKPEYSLKYNLQSIRVHLFFL